MSKLIDGYKEKVRKFGKVIVLPEGEEPRVIKAAEMIAKEGFVKVIILGDTEVIKQKCPDADLTGVTVINHRKSDKLPEFANYLYELRKAKGLTLEQAQQLVKDEMYFGVMMVKLGLADGMVGGAIHATSDLLRPALQIIKTQPGVKAVSGFFLFNNENRKDLQQMLYADCGVTPAPTVEELADIAVCSYNSAKLFLKEQPKVAMLSFSTKGSAKHPSVQKMIDATNLVLEKYPDMPIDGELQFDAAVLPSVGKLKCPGSPVAGEANVFVFPDLNAGNISYKITQRLGGYEAYGPVCQGIAKPVNDLSRGCTSEDIVGVVAITAMQACRDQF